MIAIGIASVLSILLLAGCASPSQKDAEGAAIAFVQENVKFFAKESENVTDLPTYAIDRISSYQEGGNWQVAMHVSSTLGNETKQNDLVVTISKKGLPLALNGKQIPGK